MDDEETLRTRISFVLVLGGVFALALFVRSFFVYDLALRDFLLSGGSDAFYYRWTIDNIVTTGRHLLHDEMLNYPLGMNNPRPPVYGWSVSLIGMFLGLLQGSVEIGIWQSFLFSTALWGSLTIFPTYFLGRDIFGRRAGLVAAFFLAIMPAHIQRSPLSNGDHDALVLFFVVTAFYFFLRALRELRQEEWVTRWTSPRAIVRGLRQLVLGNRRTILFSVMAGASVAAVALTWQGWAYAAVVIVAYFVVQLLVHQIRNQDSLGVLMAFTVTLGTAHLVAAPYYLATGFVRTWFDVPLILFAAAIGLGVLFTVFHRLPWVLVIPPVVLGFAGGLALTSLYSPTVASALTSGFGYFAPSKVYETIAEAQPPELSQAILSFGAFTFFMAFAGILLMGRDFVRRPRADYLFALAWSAAAIFMAMSAVRFIFNASPAFAITSAWITVLLVERLGFEPLRRAVASTGGSRLTALRRGVKVRHVAGAAFLAFLLVLPNAFQGVDAGIPYERKGELNEQLAGLPQAMRFGAFGYNLPLKNTYYPQAWEWLRTQDDDVFPLTDRPAFLSWWDYGFEAIQESRHPTVADNFQNGFEFAGHFLLAQSENQALAVLNVRLLQGDLAENGGVFSAATHDALVARGLDPEALRDVLRRPEIYVPLIRADPARFGQWDARISSRNALIIYLGAVLTEALDVDGQADLYRALREATGLRVDYFAVDSRLVPFSGTNTGIFYAPVKLTDHRTLELPGLRSIPVDFYRLVAETADGREFDLTEVPPQVRVTNVRIEYLEMFYNSMLYRIFFGLSGSDLGGEDAGLPGISGPLANEPPLHGWMLEHFRVVYRTAYYNPFPPQEVANHTDAWTALNIFDALDLQEQIQAGEAVGTVDVSSTTNLRQGVVILEFYDGAFLRGRVTAEDGRALEGVRVSVLDEAGVPHGSVFTDERGDYEARLPFGEVHVVASVGALEGRTQTGSVILTETTLQIREDQADLLPQDMDGDGLPDYIVRQDLTVPTSSVRGEAFLDRDRNQIHGPNEVGLEGFRLEVRDEEDRLVAETVTGAGGEYEIQGLLPGDYTLFLFRNATQVNRVDVALTPGQDTARVLVIPPGGLVGTVHDGFGLPAAGAEVEVVEEETGRRWTLPVGEEGTFALGDLLEGNFTLQGLRGEEQSLPQAVHVRRGLNSTVELVVKPAGEVQVRTLYEGQPVDHVSLILDPRRVSGSVTLVTDASGQLDVQLPAGLYDVYALHYREGLPTAFLGALSVLEGEAQEWDVSLQPAVRVYGRVTREDTNVRGIAVTFAQGEVLRSATTDSQGRYSLHLPEGAYRVWVLHEEGLYLQEHAFPESRRLDLSLPDADAVEGRVFFDRDGNGTWDPEEGVRGVRLRFLEEGGIPFTVVTGGEGTYRVPLRAGSSYTLTLEEAGFLPLSVGPFTSVTFVTQADLELRPETVTVEGTLLPLDPLAVEGTPVAFLPLADGAAFAEATADEDGAFAVDLLPGLYALEVDAPGDGDGTVRIQLPGERTYRVPVGKGTATLSLEVVKRVLLNGSLEVEGDPFHGALALQGPEEMLVAVEGSYAAYVRPGTYTLLAASAAGQPSVLLERINVTAPLTFNASLAPAALVEGSVTAEGQPLAQAMGLTFLRGDGAAVVLETSPTGAYSAALPPGTYTISLAWQGVDRVDGPARYVRYVLAEEVAVAAAEPLALDLPVVRTLDNATVEGSVLLAGMPAAAVVTFEAANETAIDATFPTGGIFTASLAPGHYNVYAFRSTGKSVSLAGLEVLPGVETPVALVLEPGYRVGGIVSLPDGSRRTTTLTFAAEASVSFATDASGAYEVFLPAATYVLSAELQRTERGVSVTYAAEETLALAASTTQNLQLARQDVPSVLLAWDPTERASIPAGDAVEYTLTLRNAGNVDDRYELSAAVAGWTFDFKPRRVTLPFGEENEATVRLRVTAPPDALVAHPPLVVEAASLLGTGARDLLTVEVDILQVRRIGLQPASAPPSLSPLAMEIPVALANPGNGQDTYTVVLTNPQTLEAQGWRAELHVDGEPRGTSAEGLQVAANATREVTLRLEMVGAVGPTQAVLRAFSQADPTVETLLAVPVTFPSLSIPAEDVDVQGRNVRLGAPSFPLYLYGLMAGAAAVVALLLLRRRRSRR